jgi:hypothetical protein
MSLHLTPPRPEPSSRIPAYACAGDLAAEFELQLAVLGALAGSPGGKAVAIVTRPPAGPDARPALFANLPAADLARTLRDVAARLEAGALRMPVDGSLRWVEDAEPGI